MTPEDIIWPPPICLMCRFDVHTLCEVEPFCECDCPWLYEEDP